MYGISEEELILNNGRITQAQQEINLNELRKRRVELPFNLEEVDPWCHACVLSQLEKYNNYVDAFGKKFNNKFVIKCKGITKNTLDPTLKVGFTDEQWEEIEAQIDIVKWAKKYLRNSDGTPWEARWYQSSVLRCTSPRKTLRISRRSGKTTLVVVEILYNLFTKENLKIVIAGPQKTHTEEIVNRVRDLIYDSPLLSSSVTKDLSAPYYRLKLSNKSELRGFAAGEKGKKVERSAIRGQDANMLYLEEAQYISEETMTGAVLPLLHTSPDTSLVAFSSPNRMDTTFKKLCTQNPGVKEFHYSYKVLPHYKEIEEERSSFPEEKWESEYLAGWGSNEAGVYQIKYIEAAKKLYSYSDFKKTKGWKYCIGTDWNEKYGTEIAVVGFDPLISRFRVVETKHIEPSEFTQLMGVNTLLELNKKWEPDFIYIDAGNGATNYELLMARALAARGNDEITARLIKILKKYDSGSSVLTKDLITKTEIKKPAKAFMVNASVRLFEQFLIYFSAEDQKLEKQLKNYIIARYSPSGNPVYALNEESVGDHRLDALNLALVAFELEFGELFKIAKRINIEALALPDPRNFNMQKTKNDSILNEKESRRLDKETGSILEMSSRLNVPAKIDIEKNRKTNRLGWATDEEDKYYIAFRQRQLNKQRRADKPSRQMF